MRVGYLFMLCLINLGSVSGAGAFDQRAMAPPAPDSEIGRKDTKARYDKYIAAAQNGDGEAQFQISQTYSECMEICYDRAKSMQWLRASAATGYVPAQILLADRLAPPGAKWLTQGAIDEAIIWYQKAADAGNANATYRVGSFYSEGRGVPQDSVKAFSYFLKAAQMGDSWSMMIVASEYSLGKSVPKDNEQAFYWQKKLVDSDEFSWPPFHAQLRLASLYYLGQGTEKNLAEAFKLYSKIANDKNYERYETHFTLASLYEKGEGTPKNLKAAKASRDRGIAVLTKLAETEGSAQAILGRIIADGKFKKRDDRKAIYYISKAYAAGQSSTSPYAAKFLADFYAEGRWLPRDLVYARQLYREALKVDTVESQAALDSKIFAALPEQPQLDRFRILDEGYIRMSAEQGDVTAMRKMGEFYADPNFPRADAALSRAWYQLAAGNGDKQARAILKAME